MAKPRMIGRASAYVPNNKADMRFSKKIGERNADFTYRHEDVLCAKEEKDRVREKEASYGR